MSREQITLRTNAKRGQVFLKARFARQLVTLLRTAEKMAARDYHTVFWSVAATIPRTTNGPTANTDEMATYDIMFDTAEFSDTVSQAVGMLGVLDNWDGGDIKVKLIWASADGTVSNGVTWGIRARAYGDDEALDQVPGTQVQVTDDLDTQNAAQISAASASVTPGGTPAIDELLYLQVSRNTAHADDDLGGVAKLLGVLIQYREATTEMVVW